MNTSDPFLQDMIDGIISGEEKICTQLCQAYLAQGIPEEKIVEYGIVPAMNTLDARYLTREMFIPQILVSATAVNSVLEILRPRLVDDRQKMYFRDIVVIGSVKGDIHSIGRNLLSIMLQSAGFIVVDLGGNVPTERFISAVRDHGAHSVAISSMLTTSIPQMRETIRSLSRTFSEDDLQVVIGGAPVTPQLARYLNAEYADDVLETVSCIRRFYSKRTGALPAQMPKQGNTACDNRDCDS